MSLPAERCDLNNHTPDAERMRAILTEGREKKGLKKVQLSRLLGKYDTFVCKYEKGERAIKGTEFIRIARVLDIDVSSAVRDIDPTSYDPKQSEPARTGYASTPLAQKLGIRPHMRLFAIAAPAYYVRLLDPLPEGAQLVTRLTKSTQLIHLFVTRRRQLDATLKKLARQLREDAAIWVSWPKRSSKEYTDVTADVVLDAALPLGLAEVDMCAVDSTWSGLKLVPEGKLRQ